MYVIIIIVPNFPHQPPPPPSCPAPAPPPFPELKGTKSKASSHRPFSKPWLRLWIRLQAGALSSEKHTQSMHNYQNNRGAKLAWAKSKAESSHFEKGHKFPNRL